MSISKAETKMAVVHDIGNRFEDMLEAAVGQRHQSIGAMAAAEKIAKSIRALVQVIETDFENGKITEAIEGGELEVLRLMKAYVGRTLSACDAAKLFFEQTGQIAVGKVEALQQSVKVLKKMHDTEQSKIDNLRKALESGAAELDGGDIVLQRPVGSHPGKTMKQRRLADGDSDRENPDEGQKTEPQEDSSELSHGTDAG